MATITHTEIPYQSNSLNRVNTLLYLCNINSTNLLKNFPIDVLAFFVLHFTEVLHPSVLEPAYMQCIHTFRMETMARPAPSGGMLDDGAEDEEDTHSSSTPLFRLTLGIVTIAIS